MPGAHAALQVVASELSWRHMASLWLAVWVCALTKAEGWQAAEWQARSTSHSPSTVCTLLLLLSGGYCSSRGTAGASALHPWLNHCLEGCGPGLAGSCQRGSTCSGSGRPHAHAPAAALAGVVLDACHTAALLLKAAHTLKMGRGALAASQAVNLQWHCSGTGTGALPRRPADPFHNTPAQGGRASCCCAAMWCA